MASITVQIKQIYGNETVYPACQTSAFFCKLAGTKTITGEMLRLIRAQGYSIEIEAPRILFAA